MLVLRVVLGLGEGVSVREGHLPFVSAGSASLLLSAKTPPANFFLVVVYFCLFLFIICLVKDFTKL